jgi:hypothetical protein
MLNSMKMLKTFFLFVFTISVLIEVEGAINPGIRNFKFRKKDKNVSSSKSPDVKRYYDGKLNQFKPPALLKKSGTHCEFGKIW